MNHDEPDFDEDIEINVGDNSIDKDGDVENHAY